MQHPGGPAARMFDRNHRNPVPDPTAFCTWYRASAIGSEFPLSLHPLLAASPHRSSSPFRIRSVSRELKAAATEEPRLRRLRQAQAHHSQARDPEPVAWPPEATQTPDSFGSWDSLLHRPATRSELVFCAHSGLDPGLKASTKCAGIAGSCVTRCSMGPRNQPADIQKSCSLASGSRLPHTWPSTSTRESTRMVDTHRTASLEYPRKVLQRS